jgi:hypothetical protein
VGAAVVTLARALAGCAAWLAACLGLCAAGCLDPDYHCKTSHDCDVGVDGRCEVDQRCTAYDPSCPLHRRYSDHSGPASNTCFDDAVTPANLCAAGQPPARKEGCAATVCGALPSCCDTGWSEACVQQAQLSCSDVRCDTQIAITASDKTGNTELVNLTWDGVSWKTQSPPRKSVLAWLAPAPGQIQPRLAGFATTGSALVYDGGSVPLSPDHSYLEATSVDFDRDGRPTAVLGYTDVNGNPHLEVVKLDDGSSRSISTLAARLSWGALDHDPFPVGMATTTNPGSATYRLLTNDEVPTDHTRTIGPAVDSSMAGNATANTPQVRGFGWNDANHDGRLDAIAYGSEVNVHLGQPLGLSDTPQIRVDCHPLGLSSTCNGTGGTTDTQPLQSFAGAVVPEPAGAALVIAEYPKGAMVAASLYRVEFTGSSLAFPQMSTYMFPSVCSIPPCPQILAVVARDLDGDHKLDIIAIDSDLQVYTASGSEPRLNPVIKLTLPMPMTVFELRTSVTGAPR